MKLKPLMMSAILTLTSYQVALAHEGHDPSFSLHHPWGFLSLSFLAIGIALTVVAFVKFYPRIDAFMRKLHDY